MFYCTDRVAWIIAAHSLSFFPFNSTGQWNEMMWLDGHWTSSKIINQQRSCANNGQLSTLCLAEFFRESSLVLLFFMKEQYFLTASSTSYSSFSCCDSWWLLSVNHLNFPLLPLFSRAAEISRTEEQVLMKKVDKLLCAKRRWGRRRRRRRGPSKYVCEWLFLIVNERVLLLLPPLNTYTRTQRLSSSSSFRSEYGKETMEQRILLKVERTNEPNSSFATFTFCPRLTLSRNLILFGGGGAAAASAPASCEYGA